jgi:hypothetical protein
MANDEKLKTPKSSEALWNIGWLFMVIGAIALIGNAFSH